MSDNASEKNCIVTNFTAQYFSTELGGQAVEKLK